MQGRSSFSSLSTSGITSMLSGTSARPLVSTGSDSLCGATWWTMGMSNTKQFISILSSIASLPWCNSARERAKASPMPVPCTMFFPSLYRTKGRNISSRMSKGIIFPSLLAVTRKCSSFSSTVNWKRAKVFPYFKALVSRLLIILVKASLSTEAQTSFSGTWQVKFTPLCLAKAVKRLQVNCISPHKLHSSGFNLKPLFSVLRKSSNWFTRFSKRWAFWSMISNSTFTSSDSTLSFRMLSNGLFIKVSGVRISCATLVKKSILAI